MIDDVLLALASVGTLAAWCLVALLSTASARDYVELFVVTTGLFALAASGTWWQHRLETSWVTYVVELCAVVDGVLYSAFAARLVG